jgi:recombination DNA repair RAD52 pathway protein
MDPRQQIFFDLRKKEVPRQWIRTRPGARGMTHAYVEYRFFTDEVFPELSRNGIPIELIVLEENVREQRDERSGMLLSVVIVRKVRVKILNESYEDIGTAMCRADGSGQIKPEMLTNAMKAAVTYAYKRALAHFGRYFGSGIEEDLYNQSTPSPTTTTTTKRIKVSGGDDAQLVELCKIVESQFTNKNHG